jgi:HPt (histidine-containing phosphotransfer) domain-containing protein
MLALKDPGVGVDDATESAPSSGRPPGAPVPPHYSVDWDALLDSIDGDAGFARDLTGAFIEVADRELARIAAALNAGDAAVLRESAHTLKGASANLRASAITSAAAQLESAAALGDEPMFPQLVQALIMDVTRTIAYLRSKAS